MIRILAFNENEIHELDGRRIDEVVNYPVVWVDVVGYTEVELGMIQKRFNLHPLAIEDVTHGAQAPKLDEYDDYLFSIVHSMKYTKGKISYEEIYFFISDRWLISIHREDRHIGEIFSKASKIFGPSTPHKTPDFIYYSLADRIIDDYSTVLNEVEESIDSLEEDVEENPSKEMLHRMDDLRRDLVTIRRSVWPTLTFVRDTLRGMNLLISDQNIAYFRDLRDHLTRLIDQIEAYHNRVNSVGQLYLASVAASTNAVMKLFTVLATIFLPPTLIASIYGMNFINLPEFQWRFGYPFALTLMLLVAVLPSLYLKKKHVL